MSTIHRLNRTESKSLWPKTSDVDDVTMRATKLLQRSPMPITGRDPALGKPITTRARGTAITYLGTDFAVAIRDHVYAPTIIVSNNRLCRAHRPLRRSRASDDRRHRQCAGLDAVDRRRFPQAKSRRADYRAAEPWQRWRD